MALEKKPADAYRQAVESPDPPRLQSTARHFRILKRMVGYQLDLFQPGSYSAAFTGAELWSIATHITHKLDLRARLDDPEVLLDETQRVLETVKK